MKMLAFLCCEQTPARSAVVVARHADSAFSAHDIGGDATKLPQAQTENFFASPSGLRLSYSSNGW
jgi:hypothetical protein